MRPHYQISKFVSLRGALVHGTSFLNLIKLSHAKSRKDTPDIKYAKLAKQDGHCILKKLVPSPSLLNYWLLATKKLVPGSSAVKVLSFFPLSFFPSYTPLNKSNKSSAFIVTFPSVSCSSASAISLLEPCSLTIFSSMLPSATKR